MNKKSLFKRHEEAIKFIKNKSQPNCKIINKVLSNLLKGRRGSLEKIDQTHINLCNYIFEKRITLNLPRPKSKYITPFSKVAGPENLDSLKKSGKFIPGCYRIWGLGYPEKFCYIGQSIHLGRRIKYHAKGSNINTRKFCHDLKDKAKVDLFILPKDNNIITKLTIRKFLCVLEQYFIFKFKPEINRLYIAIPGFVWDDKLKKKHTEIVGKKIYLYLKFEVSKNLELIYVSPSRSYVSRILGYERNWVKNILIRNSGWYKDTFYFSVIPLTIFNKNEISYNVITNLKRDNEIKSYFNKNLKDLKFRRKGILVKITDVSTGKIYLFQSKREASRILKIDFKSIYERDKLFKNKYKIEIIK